MSDVTQTAHDTSGEHQPSEAGYRAHRRRSEPACEACKLAHARYVRERRAERMRDHD